jgi:osmoprotectant transport system substrate-binding protein
MRMHRKLALGAATLALVLSACSPGEGESASAGASQPSDLPSVSIGSAGFPEAALVAEIYAQALEANGFTVDRHLELGERDAVRAAFGAGEINLAPDYLGGLASLLGAEVSADADATHEAMVTALGEEEPAQTALDYSPGTDADGFVVRQETADELSLATMSDLAGVADQLVWGLASGCPDNPLCGPGLNEVYGIDIGTLDTESLTPCSAEIAEALNNSAIDVAQVCTTQAEIAGFNFVLMEDDKGLAPAQNIAPVLTQELADAGGDSLASALNAVSELLTTDELTNLNLRIADQESYEDIASGWLSDNGLN